MYRIDQTEEKFHESYNHDVPKQHDPYKQSLINFIFNNVNLSKFRYDILQYESDLPKLLQQKYFVSANFSGSNCLLVFCKIRDKYHSFLVDRKTLSYNVNKINFDNVKIFNIKVKLDVEIYKGSIFDGIYIQTKKGKTFVITDVYMFKGNNFTASQIDSKILSVLSYLKSNYNYDDPSNTLCLTVNRLYKLDEIETLIKTDIPKLKDFIIKSICFYPNISGTKSIFRLDNEKCEPKFQPKFRQEYVKHEFVKPETLENAEMIPNIETVHNVETTKQVYTPKKNKKYVFDMRKTNTTDVYMLNIVDPVMKNGKKQLKLIKVGIAYIPNIERSKWCKEMTESRDNILVHCEYHKDKYKWEPKSLAEDAQKPSLVSDFNLETV